MALKNRFEQWLQAQWYGQAAPNPGLRPLEGLYRRAVEVRRQAYRDGRKKTEKLPVPTLVVGNLTVGGTGKTPLTIWLAGFLKQQGWRPGIVSRGYGGATQPEPLAVTAATDPRHAGDEPVLIARRTGCPVYVFPARAQAARALLAATDCDLIIADDGLQHYALARDIEIAVIDAARGFGNGRCLPAGPLREPPERLGSVDLVVYSGEAAAGGYGMALEGGHAVSLRDEMLRRPLADFAGQPCHALAGIGNPERFFAHLRRHGLACEGRALPDHHAYSKEDLEFAGAAPLFMTEKDAVKCRTFAGPAHWQVPVEARLPEEFGGAVLGLLAARSNSSHRMGGALAKPIMPPSPE
ncbi:tetraacyldisaccharide 4'-kinase [Methylomagnum sp.]